MGKFIADEIVKKLINTGKVIKGAKVQILGLTFKENVRDLRNSKIMDIIRELEKFDIKVYAKDPHADIEEIKREYNIEIDTNPNNEKVDALVFAVAHNEFKKYTISDIKLMLKKDSNLVFDIKNMLDKHKMQENGIDLWRL